MEIRFADSNDNPMEISRVYEESWKSAYRGIIPDEFLDNIPKGRWATFVNKKDAENIILTEDKSIIGVSSISKSRWEGYEDCGEIISLYLLPEYTGRGYGKKLFERCMQELYNKGYERLVLWVLEDNVKARKMYEKIGFVPTDKIQTGKFCGKELKEILYLK